MYHVSVGVLGVILDITMRTACTRSFVCALVTLFLYIMCYSASFLFALFRFDSRIVNAMHRNVYSPLVSHRHLRFATTSNEACMRPIIIAHSAHLNPLTYFFNFDHIELPSLSQLSTSLFELK